MSESSGAGFSIIEALVDRYRRLHSYRDEGVVLQPDSFPEVRFKTSFVAPELFRFEFSTAHPFPGLRHRVTKHVVGSDGRRAYDFEVRPGRDGVLRIVSDVGMAVAGATGISSGAAHTIARLLIPSVGGLALTDLRDWRADGETVVDGQQCVRLVGIHPRGGAWEIAVDKALGLLRSVAHDIEEDGRQLQIRRSITVDDELDDDAFSVPDGGDQQCRMPPN